MEIKTRSGLIFTACVLPHLVEEVRHLLREGSNDRPKKCQILACLIHPTTRKPIPCFMDVTQIVRDSISWNAEKEIFYFSDRTGNWYQIRSPDLNQGRFEELLTRWVAPRGMLCSLNETVYVVDISTIVHEEDSTSAVA